MNPDHDQSLVRSSVNLSEFTVELTDLMVCPKSTLVFALYDHQTNEFGPPTTAASASLLVASIMGMIHADKSVPVAIRPNDFSLHYIGVYCPTVGIFIDIQTVPAPVGNLAELIEICTPDGIKSVLEAVDRLYNTIMKDQAPAA